MVVQDVVEAEEEEELIEADNLEKEKRPFIAAVLVALSALFFASMVTSPKTLYLYYPSANMFMLLFFRSLFGLIVLTPYVVYRHF